MTIAKLYLVRHGQTTWNRDGNRYAGRTDIPLTDEGVLQAVRTASALAAIPFDAIYSSAMQRARLTAEAIAKDRYLAVISDDRLNEMDYGNWEGMQHDEIVGVADHGWRSWSLDPVTYRAGTTGETAMEVAERMKSFVQERLTDGTTILAVAHHTSGRLLMAATLGMPLVNFRRLTLDNASVSLFELSELGRNWRYINRLELIGPESIGNA